VKKSVSYVNLDLNFNDPPE